ncbi:hypothetical protein GQ43DRAFT_497371 [Delitschia confertaspora ATCC 74209]|uniref:Uncharacterized protein n=1 Tax=Delitschia confertaspora ATCC 74209 TaxID=1513339 RepID=A0A9P4MNH0_9PLEO|nr:hypothetical protein GQ43DRAFT_497371 [Delitschia confertaspora ATCC 74209]
MAVYDAVSYLKCEDDFVIEKVKPKKERAESTADALLSFDEPLKWHLIGILLYILTLFVIIGFAYSGPSLHGAWSQRVLPTGSIKVDQFYSGIASVGLMVPAAALISQICMQFGLLHPFSIAHRVPVSAADLDRMIDVGPMSLWTVWKYSPWRAGMVGTLMVIGAAIVPVSSLILATGNHAPRIRHTGVVGIPVVPSNILNMSSSMGYSGLGPFNPQFDSSKDLVLAMIADTYKGYIVSRKMLLNRTTHQLGPVATLNLTFTPGATYEGVVSFRWEAQCEPAHEDIEYTIGEASGKPKVTFVFPDGTENESSSWDKGGSTTIYMWNDGEKGVSGLPRGRTTFIAQASLMENYNSTRPLGEEGITATNQGTWISRVKCRPSMEWQVSSCTATHDGMQNCTATPGKNTTGLDTAALDALTGYMTAVPWLLYLRDDYSFRMTLEPFFVMPTVAHYERILGVLAQSIVAVTTAGYFGTASVPVIGETPRPVYIVRVHVLFILQALLGLVLVLSSADLLYSRIWNLPFRKATFLTIAYAVHGRGVEWDEGCGCVKSREELRKSNQVMLKYGIDVQNRLHVGFAADVRSWKQSLHYDDECCLHGDAGDTLCFTA